MPDETTEPTYTLEFTHTEMTILGLGLKLVDDFTYGARPASATKQINDCAQKMIDVLQDAENKAAAAASAN